MRKISISVIIFLFVFALYGETIMIETVDSGPYADLEQEYKEQIIQMETGVMESLFDGGHLFFNMYSRKQSIGDEWNKSLLLARQSGARWLIRLSVEENNIQYTVFNLKTLIPSEEGNISRIDIDPNSKMTQEEFYFEAGKAAGNSAIAILNKP